MNKQQILAMASKDPRFQQGADILETRLSALKVTPAMLKELVETLEFVMKDPNRYNQVREMAIKKGFVQPQDIPEQFNPVFVMSLLLALYAMQDRLAKGSRALAQGGLADYGRSGDSMLAHVNPMEAEVLRRMGGSGGINPNTGIREFKGGGLGSILSAIVPVAVDFFTGGAGGIVSSMIGGAAGAAVGGGNILQGAITGGLGAGLGNVLGEGAAGMMGDFGKGLSANTTGLMGNAIAGGLAGAASGQGILQGAARGLAGGFMNQATSGMSPGMQAAGQTAGNMITGGASVQNALIGGGLAGLAQGIQKPVRPSDKVANPNYELQSGVAPTAPGMGVGQGLLPQGGLQALATANQQSPVAPQTPAAPASSGLMGLTSKQLMTFAPAVLSMLGSAQTPQQVQQATATMTPQQKEYFDRELPKWDWNKLQQQAAAAGQTLGGYLAANMGKSNEFPTATPPVAKAAGGALSMLVSGGGSGRDDKIDARLSDGEYVFDAETTALVGDGSVKEGARRLDLMRSQIRKHKGKNLASGKISPNAKSPLTYLKEVA
jgi:hypothetical protein